METIVHFEHIHVSVNLGEVYPVRDGVSKFLGHSDPRGSEELWTGSHLGDISSHHAGRCRQSASFWGL